jgi:DNA repair exonuclease SbcCD ATPase subunit
MKSRRHTSKLTRSVRSAKKRVTKLRRSLKKSMKKGGSKSKRTRSLRKSLKKAKKSLKTAQKKSKKYSSKGMSKKSKGKGSRKGSMSKHVAITLEDRCYAVGGSDFKPLQIKGKDAKDKLIKSLRAKGKKGITNRRIKCHNGIKRSPTKFGSGH